MYLKYHCVYYCSKFLVILYARSDSWLAKDNLDFEHGSDKKLPYWEYQSNLYSAVENSYAVILLTAWDEYKTIDWERVSSIVKSPFWIFDTRLILDTKNLKDFGLNIWQLGIGNNN